MTGPLGGIDSPKPFGRPVSPSGAPQGAFSSGRAALPAPVQSGARRDLAALAAAFPRALLDLRRAEARLVEQEAAGLARLKQCHGWQDLGFSSFHDLLREALQLSSSTAAERIALHHLLQIRPAFLDAFLAGRITAGQALAVAPVVTGRTEDFWLGRCCRLPVRALKARVRMALRQMAATSGPDNPAPGGTACGTNARPISAAGDELPGSGPDGGLSRTVPFVLDDEPSGRSISFAAPPEAAVAWEAGLEMARRVLGWQAPRHACVEAILAEAAPEAGGVGADASFEAAGDPGAEAPAGSPLSDGRRAARILRLTPPVFGAAPNPAVTGRPTAIARAWRTIDAVSRHLAELDHQTSLDSAGDPAGTLQTLLRLQGAARPLRVLFARLLREAWQARAIHYLGFPSLAAFVECRLHLSPRSARARLAEAELFRDFPTLEAAFGGRRIGVGQALLLRRGAPPRRLVDFVARAATITHRQLRREIKLRQALRRTRPTLAARFDGPLPLPGLEEALLNELRDRGVDPAGLPALRALTAPLAEPCLDREFARWFTPPDRQIPEEPPPACPSTDPAENPLVMRRLEVLLDALALADCQARLADTPDNEPSCNPGSCDDSRQTFGSPSSPATVAAAAPQPSVTIRFWAPQPVADHWTAAISSLRQQTGNPLLPTWAGVTLLLRTALQQWQHHDPESRPTHYRTLERDEYLCQAPGCTARRNLEVHHIIFRSHGGRDVAANRLALCHAHHAWGIHRGRLTLTGRAPHALQWVTRVGTLRGDKYVTRGR